MTIQPKPHFDLHDFFPYLVRVFYKSVSESVSQIYGSMFDLTVSEWRVMVVLGPNRVLSAGEIVQLSSMTNVNVSRAISSLTNSGLLRRNVSGDDKRRAALGLTTRGIAIFDALIPLVSKLEKELLQGLTEDQILSLVSMMETIRENAERFIEREEKQARDSLARSDVAKDSVA